MLIAAKSKTLTENVTDQLLTLIRTGAWKPGELLPSENQLTQQLDVSRAASAKPSKPSHRLGSLSFGRDGAPG